MSNVRNAMPMRLLLTIFVLALLLVGSVRALLHSHANVVEEVPAMSKPSIFYQLNRATTSPYEEVQQLQRHAWQGAYELDAIDADPNTSAWAAGHYEVPGPGINPDAVGKLSDQELMLFRNELRGSFDGDWRYAPSEIRNRYEQLYREQGITQ